MLNDREVIEHWHLRDVVIWLTLAVIALLLTAILLSTLALAIEGARGFLGMIAAADVAAGLLVGVKLTRVWKRLEALEKFV